MPFTLLCLVFLPCTSIAPISPHVRYYSLSNLFPSTETNGENLSDVWDSDAAFRVAVRLATRKSLFMTPPLPPPDTPQDVKAKYERRLQALKMVQVDLSSTANGSWDVSACPLLDKVFEERGLNLTGSHFIRSLGNLMSTTFSDSSSIPPNYSWLDIATNYQRPQPYAFHSDSGVPCQDTVMLGFPAENNYDGPDVFSHIALVKPGEMGRGAKAAMRFASLIAKVVGTRRASSLP